MVQYKISWKYWTWFLEVMAAHTDALWDIQGTTGAQVFFLSSNASSMVICSWHNTLNYLQYSDPYYTSSYRKCNTFDGSYLSPRARDSNALWDIEGITSQ